MPHEDGLAAVGGERFDFGPERREARGPDEHRFDRAAQPRRVERRLERIDLAAEGVPGDRRVQKAQALRWADDLAARRIAPAQVPINAPPRR